MNKKIAIIGIIPIILIVSLCGCLNSNNEDKQLDSRIFGSWNSVLETDNDSFLVNYTFNDKGQFKLYIKSNNYSYMAKALIFKYETIDNNKLNIWANNSDSIIKYNYEFLNEGSTLNIYNSTFSTLFTKQ
jgi:hypothetical protein